MIPADLSVEWTSPGTLADPEMIDIIGSGIFRSSTCRFKPLDFPVLMDVHDFTPLLGLINRKEPFAVLRRCHTRQFLEHLVKYLYSL